ncbi:MAG: deoxynucleoside kinase [Candidatus Babeliales bacterium]|jgi:deoxyadenosine/deoxycytidine kinase
MVHQADHQKSFIVEGNIGAGKSTFLRLIKDHLPVSIVYEPLDQWQAINGQSLLDKFYQDTQRWGYTFQSYAFITRVMQQEKDRKLNPWLHQVLERSVYSDRYCFAKNCFEMGTLTELEWTLYQEWFSWLVENYTTKPSGFIYLQTDPAICFERLQKRARKEESLVPFSYLESLHNKHEDWLIYKKNIADYLIDTPVLILDCNQDFENSPELLKGHVEKIAHFIGVAPLGSHAISSRIINHL